MKALIIILIVAIIGYAVWKFKESRRIRNAKKPSIHKATINSSTYIKTAKEISDDFEMEQEIMRMKMEKANEVLKEYDSSKIKKLN